jgi:hypothetical protein
LSKIQSIYLSGFPIKARVPKDAILLGAKGVSSRETLEKLSKAVVEENFRGIMVWYSSVKNGIHYASTFDASNDKAAQGTFIDILNQFNAVEAN